MAEFKEAYAESAQFDYFNHTEYNYTELYENLQVVLYSVIAFCVPFVLSHPQLLVGTVVNMMLILGAQNLRGYKLFGMIFTPSLGVIASGLIFGGLTKYLLFFMPMIWVGNILLVYGYKYMRHHFKSGVIKSISAAVSAKVLLLTLTAYVLVSFDIVPDIFLSAMSFLQLTTALLGAAGALTVSKFILGRFAEPSD